MTPDEMARRLEALSHRINAELPAGMMASEFQAVVIFGGLPPGEPMFATAGGHEWLREWPLEELGDFADRAVAGARELKERLLVIGGLPRNDAQQDLAMAAHRAWELTDSGVPPMEDSLGAVSPVRRAIDDRSL
jgi:hypothetical protein